MRKNLLSLFSLFLLLSVSVFPQVTLTQTGFNSVLLPKYMGSGGTTRLPFVYRATVTGLTPNTTYRYYTQAARFTDLGGSNSGAGNPLLINPDSTNFAYTTGPSVLTAGAYSIFTTNSTGEYTGWFAFVNTANARFTAGNYIIPTIVIGVDTGVILRRALNDSIKVMSFSTNAADTNGTGIWGRSMAQGKSIIALYDNTAGNTKPLAITYAESEGLAIASVVTFYADSVNGVAGSWGTIVPNANANGIRRVENRSLTTGAVLGFSTSSNGTWPSGVNTVNPSGAAANPLKITLTDAPLPVELTSFTASVVNGTVVLNWKTVTELNNSHFEIEKRDEFNGFQTIGMVKGNGTTSMPVSYSFTDNNIIKGNFEYRLKQVNFDGTFSYSGVVSVNSDLSEMSYALHQNYPNPFNPSTSIRYELQASGYVTLKIYNIHGEEVRTLVNGMQDAGSKIASWDGKDNSGISVASDVYFYRLESGNFTQTMKMMLLK